MSWLYGQTWLWYLIAFLVGVALAWLLLVRPQQRRLHAIVSGRSAEPAPAAVAPGVDDAVTEQFPPVAPVLFTKGSPAAADPDGETAVVPRPLVATGRADGEPVEAAAEEDVPAAAVVAGPYPGSALPAGDGSAPSAEFTIKGNADSGLYHTPSSPYYSRTKAEAWFTTAEDAEAAGFTAWKRK